MSLEAVLAKTAISVGVLGMAVTVTADNLTDGEYTSDIVAVLFAVCGGIATQIGLVAKAKIPVTLIISELMFSAIGGFATHAIMMTQTEEQRIIWSCSAIVGAAGSKALRAYGQKYLGHWKIFQDDSRTNKND